MKALTKCPPRTAVAYARYSSAGQRDVSIAQQLSDIRAFALREGYTIVHEYADHARSGFKDLSARSEFLAMITDAAARGFDTVLCWKVDRFGRSRADSATYKQHLARLGVRVVYVMEPIPSGAAGVLTEGMLEAIAEWYSRNLAENVSRGMRDNATKCLYNGTRLLGYTCGPDKHYQIIPEEASVVRLIFSRYIAGYSAASICRELSAQGLLTVRGRRYVPETLLRIISNERYTGVYIWGDIRVENGMPAIISHSDWEAAQLMKQKTARHVEQRTCDFLLSGKAFCGCCGRAMIGDSGTSRTGVTHYYYTCQGRKSRTGCKKANVRKTDLEDFVVRFIFSNCLTDEAMDRAADLVMQEMEERRKKSPLASLEREYDEVTTKIANINEAICNGIWNSSTSAILTDLENRQQELKENIGVLRYQETQTLSRDRILFFLHRFAKLNPDDPEHRRRLINTFISAVYVYDDHLKILTNVTENSTPIPRESLPDLPFSGSDIVASGVLVGTHPNQIMLWHIARM